LGKFGHRISPWVCDGGGGGPHTPDERHFVNAMLPRMLPRVPK
jgi:hypothetical protein